jgi:hypothetical protein
MTHFHLDLWSQILHSSKIKLVDFGADGAFNGGDDKEHEIVIDAPAKGSWVRLTSLKFIYRTNYQSTYIAQLILVEHRVQTLFTWITFIFTIK